MLCPQTPRRNNQGLPVSKVRLLERVDSSHIIHPVARLPLGPCSHLMVTQNNPQEVQQAAVENQGLRVVRSWRDHTPEPAAPVVLRPNETEFSKGSRWWRADDWKTWGYKPSHWREGRGTQAPHHGSANGCSWLQSREPGWVSNSWDRVF